MRDLIRHDQERKDKLAAMQAAITEGVESGIAKDFDMETLQQELDEA